MRTSSLPFALALLLASAVAAQAQPVAASHDPPTAADFTARAAANAAQALDMAAASAFQPAPFSIPDPVIKPKASGFDPNSVHYPYGRVSLGNIDPSSAANPYSPYASPPNPGFGSPAALPGPPTGVFHGGILGGRH